MENELLNTPEEDDEIDLLELVYYYLSHALYIIAACILGAVIAGVFTWQCITPTYTATTKMYMVSASAGSVVDLTDLNIGTDLASDYQELIQTREIYNEVKKNLSLDYSYKEMQSMISVSNISDTRIIAISVEDSDPKEAATIANNLAKVVQKRLPSVMDSPEPTIAEKAVVPTQKSSPSYKKNILIGGVGFAFVVVAVLTILFLLDDTLKSAEDVEKEFGVMPLTVIGEASFEGSKKDSKKKKLFKKK